MTVLPDQIKRKHILFPEWESIINIPFIDWFYNSDSTHNRDIEPEGNLLGRLP